LAVTATTAPTTAAIARTASDTLHIAGNAAARTKTVATATGPKNDHVRPLFVTSSRRYRSTGLT
jgi:hypothetical protein